ncbi:hypothetical protein PTKIN_Ptkin15bG0053200 [Pterospermum kingtungense]
MEISCNNSGLSLGWCGLTEIMNFIREGRRAAALSDNFVVKFMEFNLAQGTSLGILKKNRVQWKPQSENYVKVNFDGALRAHEKQGGIGVVICNSSGEFMRALAVKVQWVMNPLMVEALAAVRASVFALDMGFRFIELEGDSLGVADKLNSMED